MHTLRILPLLLTTGINSQHIWDHDFIDDRFIDTIECYTLRDMHKAHNATLYMMLNSEKISDWHIETNKTNIYSNKNITVHSINNYTLCIKYDPRLTKSDLTIILRNDSTIYDKLEREVKLLQTKLNEPKNGSFYFSGENLFFSVTSAYSKNIKMNVLFPYASPVDKMILSAEGRDRFGTYNLHDVPVRKNVTITATIGAHKVHTNINIIPLPKIIGADKMYLNDARVYTVSCNGFVSINTSTPGRVTYNVWKYISPYTYLLNKVYLNNALNESSIQYNFTCMGIIQRDNIIHTRSNSKIVTIYKTYTGNVTNNTLLITKIPIIVLCILVSIISIIIAIYKCDS